MKINSTLPLSKNSFKFYAVVLPFALCVLSFASAAQAAVLYFSPESADVYEQTTFVVELRLDTQGESINAIDAEVTFPLNVFEVVDVNKGGSIFPLYPTEPTYSNARGNIVVQAGVPKGFEGDGLIIRVFLKAKEKGEGTLRFSGESRALLNDGFGTPASMESKGATYTVSERSGDIIVISSPTHADEQRWAREPVIRMSWERKEGTSFSYVLSKNPEEAPDEKPGEPVDNAEFVMEEDGIFYFHLRSCASGVCGPTVTRRAMKDTVPPEPFKVQLGQDPDAFGGKRFLSFLAADTTSGIDHYEILKLKAAKQEHWEFGASPYVLEDDALIRQISVKAVDKAGNERIESIVIEESRVVDKNFFLFAVIVGILIGIGILIISAKRKSQN